MFKDKGLILILTASDVKESPTIIYREDIAVEEQGRSKYHYVKTGQCMWKNLRPVYIANAYSAFLKLFQK